MTIQNVLIPRLVEIQAIDEHFVTYSSSFQVNSNYNAERVTSNENIQNLVKELIDSQKALYPHGKIRQPLYRNKYTKKVFVPQEHELAHRAPKRIRLSEPQPISSEKAIAQQILEKAAEIIDSNDVTCFDELARAAR